MNFLHSIYLLFHLLNGSFVMQLEKSERNHKMNTRTFFSFFHWIYAEISWASILHIRTSRDFNLKWSCWCLAPTLSQATYRSSSVKLLGALRGEKIAVYSQFFFLSFLSISFISSGAAACAFCNKQWAEQTHREKSAEWRELNGVAEVGWEQARARAHDDDMDMRSHTI